MHIDQWDRAYLALLWPANWYSFNFHHPTQAHLFQIDIMSNNIDVTDCKHRLEENLNFLVLSNRPIFYEQNACIFFRQITMTFEQIKNAAKSVALLSVLSWLGLCKQSVQYRVKVPFYALSMHFIGRSHLQGEKNLPHGYLLEGCFLVRLIWRLPLQI